MIQHPSENRENGCFSGRHREDSLRNRNAFVTYALIAINVAVFFFDEIFFGSTLDTGVLIRAGGAYVPYISSGQYWRLFTAMFMHSGMQHLLAVLRSCRRQRRIRRSVRRDLRRHGGCHLHRHPQQGPGGRPQYTADAGYARLLRVFQLRRLKYRGHRAHRRPDFRIYRRCPSLQEAAWESAT